MIIDYEQNLTAVTANKGGGEAIKPASGTPVYGTRPYDLKASSDLGVGEKVTVFVQVTEAYNSLTSVAFSLVGCTDATDPGATTAGTSEADVLPAVSKALTSILDTVGTTFRLGVVGPGVTKRLLRLKCATTGTTPTTGAVKAWLQVGDDSTPANKALTL
jgi:hypothetical protein